MSKYYDNDSEKLEYISTAPVWETMNNYKLLLEYYRNHRYTNRPSDERIRERIKYILDNKIVQRDEIATLYWVLGEVDERENKIN